MIPPPQTNKKQTKQTNKKPKNNNKEQKQQHKQQNNNNKIKQTLATLYILKCIGIGWTCTAYKINKLFVGQDFQKNDPIFQTWNQIYAMSTLRYWIMSVQLAHNHLGKSLISRS